MSARRWCPCVCPLGVWPSCGQRRQCGPWEQRARRAGVLLIEIEGLTHPRLLAHTGCPPLFYLPAWSKGPVRELIVGWLCGELALWAYGEESVVDRLGGMVRNDLFEETG